MVALLFRAGVSLAYAGCLNSFPCKPALLFYDSIDAHGFAAGKNFARILLPGAFAQVYPGHLLPLNHLLFYAGIENCFVVASRSYRPC